jgi:hypothetical protein
MGQTTTPLKPYFFFPHLFPPCPQAHMEEGRKGSVASEGAGPSAQIQRKLRRHRCRSGQVGVVDQRGSGSSHSPVKAYFFSVPWWSSELTKLERNAR